MKKAAIAMLITSVIGLSACQPQAVDPLKVEVVTLETDQQKQAYALGSNLGAFLQNRLNTLEGSEVELDKAIILKGIVAAMQDQSQFSQEEAREHLKALDVAMQAAQKAADDAASEANLEAGKAYLAENAKREGVTETESGLQYEVMVASEGDKPGPQDTVKVHYHGTLLDGTVFDSSVDRGTPATFPLHRVISGWTEGLQYMNVGSKYKFHIPSELAYGTRATGKISPNSTLVFEVELLEIVGKEVTN